MKKLILTALNSIALDVTLAIAIVFAFDFLHQYPVWVRMISALLFVNLIQALVFSHLRRKGYLQTKRQSELRSDTHDSITDTEDDDEPSDAVERMRYSSLFRDAIDKLVSNVIYVCDISTDINQTGNDEYTVLGQVSYKLTKINRGSRCVNWAISIGATDINIESHDAYEYKDIIRIMELENERLSKIVEEDLERRQIQKEKSDKELNDLMSNIVKTLEA